MSHRSTYKDETTREIEEHMLMMQRQLVGNAAKLATTGISIECLRGMLQDLPNNAPVDVRIPTGRFWIIGPNPNGLCFAYRQLAGFSPESCVTIHRYQDLVNAGIVPMWGIAEVQR